MSYFPQRQIPNNNAGLSGFLGRPPENVRHGPFKGPKDTLAAMERIALGPRGEHSTLVRQFTEFVTKDIWPKDYLGEIIAVRNVLVQPAIRKLPNGAVEPDLSRPMFRYANDPRHVEWIKDPQRLIEEVNERGATVLDCDEYVLLGGVMCLQLGREVEFVAAGYGPDELTHVGYRVKEPKSNRWIWCDPVAGPRERAAAAGAVEVLSWSID